MYGGGYRAEQNSDGTWNVLDVPIFGEHVRMYEGEEPFVVDRQWLESAVKAAQDRWTQDGYLPPLHVRHHSSMQSAESAGHFMLKGLQRITYEGKPLTVVMADLLRIPSWIYEEIRDGRLPYRSVEILEDRPEIDSLALLDHEVPYFRFPLLTIATETPQPSQPIQLRARNDSRPLVASYSATSGGKRRRSMLYRFEGGIRMADEEKKKDEMYMDAPAAPDEGGMDDGEGVEGEITNDVLASKLDAIIDLLKSLAGGAAEPAPKQPTMQLSFGASATAPSEQAIPEAVRKEIAEFRAFMAQSTADRQRREKREKLTAEADKHAQALAKIGHPLELSQPTLRQYAAAGDEAGMKAYVAAAKQFATPAPPKHFTGEQSGASNPDWTQKYQGRDNLAHFRRLYKQLPSAMRRRKTEEQYVTEQFAFEDKDKGAA